MRRMSEIRDDSERLKREMEPGYNLDVLLGQLLSELERDHGVPVGIWLHQRKSNDGAAVELYHDIAESRWMVAR